MGNMCEKQKWQWTAYMIYTVFAGILLAFGNFEETGMGIFFMWLIAMCFTAWTL